MTKKSNTCWDKPIRRLAKNTRNSYYQAVRDYERFHNMEMDALIKEALNEQSERVPTHELKIYDRIVSFEEHLIDKGLILSTIKNKSGRIRSIYRKHRVTIPYITPINEINSKRSGVIKYNEILTKEEIKQGFNRMESTIMKARLLAMVTGGLSNDECASLTTRQFIDDLYQYHQKDDDLDAMRYLASSDNIIWVTMLIRRKTGKPYYAVMNPECVKLTAQAKLGELKSQQYDKAPRAFKDKLYPTTKDYFGKICRKINTECGFGKASDGRTRFRPHMFRKFHATAIGGNVLLDDDKLALSEIDELQGRGKTNVQDAYIKTNPVHQKLLYARVVNNVSLWNKYTYHIVFDDVVLEVVDDTKDLEKLRKENKILKEKVMVDEQVRDEVEYLIKTQGKDNLLKLMGEILNTS